MGVLREKEKMENIRLEIGWSKGYMKQGIMTMLRNLNEMGSKRVSSRNM